MLDHPHVSEAIKGACLVPLEDAFPAGVLAEIGSATIGPCLSSYRYGGRYWALPLDAATQVMAYRPDLAAPAADWQGVEVLAGEGGVALSLAGPHAILSFRRMKGNRAAAPLGRRLRSTPRGATSTPPRQPPLRLPMCVRDMRGYIAWQTAAAAYLREALETGAGARAVIATLDSMHATAIGDRER